MNKGEKLSPKEEAFCLAYIETANASEAYRRSYNAEKMKAATINSKASLLLGKDKIRARIEELRSGHRRRHEVTVDRIVAELAKIAFANASDYFEWGPSGVRVRPQEDLTDDQRAVVCEVSQTVTAEGGTIRVKLSDKQAALEKLGRHLGMFTDKGTAPQATFVILDKPMSADEWERQFTTMGTAGGAPNRAGSLPLC